MTRQELWRARYREDPYLEHLSRDELVQRFNDIFQNTLTFTREGKFALHPPGEVDDDRDHGENDASRWVIRFTHILEEFERRGIQVVGNDALLNRITFLKKRYPNTRRAAEIWEAAGGAQMPYLVKYGRKEHLCQLVDAGILRVAPASSYADPSLNPAIQDSELELEIHLRGARLHTLDGREIPVIGDVKVIDRVEEDYYVWCCSYSYDYRLFDDFDFHACVVIHQPREFMRRLTEQFMFQIPTAYCRQDVVSYIDPMRPVKEFSVRFSKHFRYAYQNEFRIVFLPRERSQPFKSVFLSLGDISTFCRLLTL